MKVQLTTPYGVYTKKVKAGLAPAAVAAKLVEKYAQGKPFELELKAA